MLIKSSWLYFGSGVGLLTYRQFIKNFAKIAAPLHVLVKKEQK